MRALLIPLLVCLSARHTFASQPTIPVLREQKDTNRIIVLNEDAAGCVRRAASRIVAATTGTMSASSINAHTGTVESVNDGIAVVKDSSKSLKDYLTLTGVQFEIDGIMRAAQIQEPTVRVQSNAPWNLAMISNYATSVKNRYYYYLNGGRGIDCYVIDTGIDASHPEFGGRAKLVKNFVDGEEAKDLNGHGTNVGSIIGGKSRGVARGARILGVKVLDKSASGSYSTIIKGIQYVASTAVVGKTVVNFSISGAIAVSVEAALKLLVQKGIPVIAAAGNNGDDACNYTPSSMKDVVFSVGALEKDYTVASYSNTGNCVSCFAPGSDINGAYPGKPYKVSPMTGTSQASPHVAGIAACYMAIQKYNTPADLYADLVAGKRNQVKGLTSKNKSPNVVAFNWADPTVE